jgi:hypothetical protein
MLIAHSRPEAAPRRVSIEEPKDSAAWEPGFDFLDTAELKRVITVTFR